MNFRGEGGLNELEVDDNLGERCLTSSNDFNGVYILWSIRVTLLSATPAISSLSS